MVKIISLSKVKEKNTNIISATFLVDGNLIPLRVNEEDNKDNYQNTLNIIQEIQGNAEDFDASKLLKAMSPKERVAEAIKDSFYLSKELEISNGSIYFSGERLEDTLANHILSLLDSDNIPKDEKLWRSYILFLDNLHQNVNKDIRQQLFRWMDYEEKAGHPFAITEDGCLVGYKGCKGTVLNPTSSFTGVALVNGEEIKGHIPNKVGSVISMPRSAVQYDPNIGCSTGLHVGTRDYAVNWAPVLLLVKVNPRDVVSVPYECDSQKMRVCEYTVLEVTDASEEHKQFYEDQDNFEDDFEDDFEDYFEDDFEDEESDSLLLEEDDILDLIEDFKDNESGEALVLKYKKNDEDREFKGIPVSLYSDLANNNSGVVCKGANGEYKHIKLKNIYFYEFEDGDKNEEFFFEESLVLDEEDILLLVKRFKEGEGNEILELEYTKNNEYRNFEGTPVNLYSDKESNNSGVVCRDHDGEYKHIKLKDIYSYKLKKTFDLESDYLKEDLESLVLSEDYISSLGENNSLVEVKYKTYLEEDATVEGYLVESNMQCSADKSKCHNCSCSIVLKEDTMQGLEQEIYIEDILQIAKAVEDIYDK